MTFICSWFSLPVHYKSILLQVSAQKEKCPSIGESVLPAMLKSHWPYLLRCATPLCVVPHSINWDFFAPGNNNCHFALCLCKAWPKWPWPQTGSPGCSANSCISSSWEIAVTINDSDGYLIFLLLLVLPPCDKSLRLWVEKQSKRGAWSGS